MKIEMKSLDSLINDFYNEEQKEKVAMTESKHVKGTHLATYESILWAFDNPESMSEDEVCKFNDVKKSNVLQEIDWVIGSVIKTLTKLTKRDVEDGFKKAFTLNPSCPEIEYLIKETRNYLEGKQAK